MKKLVAFALVIVLALSLAACGGNDKPSNSSNSTSTPPASQGGTSTTPPPSSTPEAAPSDDVDVSTIEGFLSQFGLTEADVKPEGAGEGSHKTEREGKRGRVSWIVEDATAEVKDQWIQAIVEKTKTLATDGKIYVDSYFEDEFSFTSIADTGTSTIVWMYHYSDSDVDIKCEILDGGIFDFNININ